MVYLIIVVILLVIIGPIIAVLPSARQKERMAMRQRAMAQGISVELTSIEDPDPDPNKYLSNTGKPLERIKRVVAYRMLRERPADWRRLPRIDWCALRCGGPGTGGLPPGWAWQNELPSQMSNRLKEFIVDGLQMLPNDVVRVDEVRYMVSVYWNEQGSGENLDPVVDFLKECVEIPPWQSPDGSERVDDRSE
jgi:hypothetical protein